MNTNEYSKDDGGSPEQEPGGSVWARLNKRLDAECPIIGRVSKAPYVETEATMSLSFTINRVGGGIRIDSVINGPFGQETESVELREGQNGEIIIGRYDTQEPGQLGMRATTICYHAAGLSHLCR